MPKLRNERAVAKEGNRFLLAKKADIDRGEKNGPARVHDLDTGEYTDTQPLQVWFKWANWEDTTEAEYQAALSQFEPTEQP